jgi:integrase
VLRRQDPSVSKAKQAIADYKKALGDAEGVAELMVFYCERAAGFSLSLSHDDAGYFDALVRMFAQALRIIRAVPANVQDALIVRLARFPTKTEAWSAAQQFRVQPPQPKPLSVPTVAVLVEQYRAEKMPARFSTRSGYNAWLKNHIIPKWGLCEITTVQARPVELWLQSLTLTPKSRAHIRGLLSILRDFAAWRGDVPMQRNPMELVTVKGPSKRMRKPHSMAVEEFQKFIAQLRREPFHTIALMCVCLGLRISECLGLRWSDVDWLNGKLTAERGIVRQHVDDVKTEMSQRQMSLDAGLPDILKAWKQTTQFSAQDDWVFASPAKLGRLPWSYPHILRLFTKAAKDAEVAHVSPPVMRHTHRAWLDAVGTPIAVQQKLMRHASITTTMDHHGDLVTDEMSLASGKVAGLALNGTGQSQVIENMAERVGFEPTIPVKVCPLSRRIVSTTHAPLRISIA